MMPSRPAREGASEQSTCGEETRSFMSSSLGESAGEDRLQPLAAIACMSSWFLADTGPSQRRIGSVRINQQRRRHRALGTPPSLKLSVSVTGRRSD